MEKIKAFFSKLHILTPEQRKRFSTYLPNKVYYTERNVSFLVAATQICMIILFLLNPQASFKNIYSIVYFSLYILLLTSTCAALFLYRFAVKNEKYKFFIWLRRIYTVVLCIWVLGITFLEQSGGKTLSVYCYLMPTTAAVLLLTPIESTVIFGSTWAALVAMTVALGDKQQSIFGNMVNGIFVTALTLFISYRYYRSMAKEFSDRETIDKQYQEIKNTNLLLEKLVHVDQLTGLYNRHYMHESVNQKFNEFRNNNHYGMCLMLDIDYFKQYNDLYGHLQGDECLRSIADIVREVCDQDDASAIRYGGEEFLIVKVSEQPFKANEFAENILQKICDAGIPRKDVEQKRVTVSIGVWYSNLGAVNDIEIAIQAADNALYKAKSTGRNKIAY